MMESSIKASQTAGVSKPKPALATKPRLAPKPFSLQTNATIRSIHAPKSPTHRGKAEAGTVPKPAPVAAPQKPSTSESVTTKEQGKATKETTSQPGQDASDRKSDPVPQTTLAKESAPLEKDNRKENNQKTPADIATKLDQRDEKKEDETSAHEMEKLEELGSDVADPVLRWGSTRKRLSMALTSRFESGGGPPPAPSNITKHPSSIKHDVTKAESMSPEENQTTPELPDGEVEDGGATEDYVGGGSIKCRISQLFESRPEVTIKREEPEMINGSGGVKARIKNWAMETASETKPQFVPRPRSKSNQTSAPPPAEKTPETPTAEPPASPSPVADLPLTSLPVKQATEVGTSHVENSFGGDGQPLIQSQTADRAHETDSAGNAVKRDNSKRRSVHFGVVEKDDGGPPVVLGSESDSSSEEEEQQEREDAEGDSSVLVPVYRRVGLFQKESVDKLEAEELHHLGFEKHRRAQETEEATHTLEELRRKEEEEQKERERERQLERERLRDEEKRRLEREQERVRLEEKEREKERLRQEDLERKRKELEMVRLEEEEKAKLREEEMERQRRDLARMRLEEEREKERLRQEMERQMKEVERIRLEEEEKEKERLRQEMETERKESERIRLEEEREKERLRQEMERQMKEVERIRLEEEKEKERLRQEMERERKESERIRLEEEREKERLRQEMERQMKEVERIRLEEEKEKERLRQEMERQMKEVERIRLEEEKEQERLRHEMERERKESERIRLEEGEKERLRQEMERHGKELERIMMEEKGREKERLEQEEMERHRKEWERVRCEEEHIEKENIKEEEMERERKIHQLWHRQREDEREMMNQKEEDIKQGERESERVWAERERQRKEEERAIHESDEHKFESKLREEEVNKEKQREEEWENHWVSKVEKLKEENREEEDFRLVGESEKEEEREKYTRLEEEEEMERRQKENWRQMEKVRAQEDILISFDSDDVPATSSYPQRGPLLEPPEGNIEVDYEDFSIKKNLIQVEFDDFSVKPKKWGTRPRDESGPVIQGEGADDASSGGEEEEEEDVSAFKWEYKVREQMENTDTREAAPAPEREEEEEQLISFSKEVTSPSNRTDEPEKDEENKENGFDLTDDVSKEAEDNSCTNVEEKGTDVLIDSVPDEHNEASDQASETDSLNPPSDQHLEISSEDFDTTDFPSEANIAPFPESSTPLLNSSAQKSKADLSKRSRRTRPSRSLRAGLAQSESPDWRTSDSSEVSSKQRDSDSEDEQPRQKIFSPHPTSQRVPMFPGLSPAALIAQIKRKTGGRGEETKEDKGRGEKEEGAAPSPSQLSSSPRTAAHLAGAARVLPPIAGTDNGASACPPWLQELKSKKRLSQYDSEP